MILHIKGRNIKKIHLNENKIRLLKEGLDVKYDPQKNSFNASINNSSLDVDSQGVDTRLFGTRNDILNGDGSIEKSREGKPGRKWHMFQQKKVGHSVAETARMYRDVINFIRNFNQSNIGNIYNEFNKTFNLDQYDMIEKGPKTTVLKNIRLLSQGAPINSVISKLSTNLNNAERAASQYEKPLSNANDERFTKTDRIPRYRLMKVPFTNVNVISLFRMGDFNFSDIIKHGYIRGNDKNAETFGVSDTNREKVPDKKNVYKPFQMTYDKGVTPNISGNFSLNGADNLTRKKYGYGDENYTSISEFIDKSVMGAAYALKCESFNPSVIIDAPSSSKFNLYYCTRLSNKIGVPYQSNFFDRDMINVSMDEDAMRKDGVEEKEIISFKRTARQKGIAEIIYFMGQPIEKFFYEYNDYFTNALGNKIPTDRIILILKEWVFLTYFTNMASNDNLSQYFKNSIMLDNSHIKLSKEYNTYQKYVNNVVFGNDILMKAFMKAGSEMANIFAKYKEKLLADGVKIDFSLQRGKIVDFGGKYRKYVKDMYVVANKNAVNDPKYFERFKSKKYLLFDEDISTGSTLKLLINALHNNGVEDSNILCLTNAYSLSESVKKKNALVTEDDNSLQKPMIKGVIFDFDYTLFNTDGTLDIRRNASLVKGTPTDKKKAWIAASKYVGKNIIYSGIKELIRYLESNGIKWGVVTKCNQLFAQETINYYGLNPVAVKGNRNGWPKHKRMEEVLDIMGILPQECLSIGDRASDGAESNSANIQFIGCSWGDGIDQDKITNGVKSPIDIVNYIEQINKGNY